MPPPIPDQPDRRRGWVEVGGTLLEDGAKGSAWIPRHLVDSFYKSFPYKHYNLPALAQVLRSPDRIFFGTRPLEDDKGGWCYTGRPEFIRTGETSQRRLDPTEVFCVYLDARMQVYEWRVEPCDPSDKEKPKDPCGGRFEEQRWPPMKPPKP